MLTRFAEKASISWPIGEPQHAAHSSLATLAALWAAYISARKYARTVHASGCQLVHRAPNDAEWRRQKCLMMEGASICMALEARPLSSEKHANSGDSSIPAVPAIQPFTARSEQTGNNLLTYQALLSPLTPNARS
jgi:hypothetical protein